MQRYYFLNNVYNYAKGFRSFTIFKVSGNQFKNPINLVRAFNYLHSQNSFVLFT